MGLIKQELILDLDSKVVNIRYCKEGHTYLLNVTLDRVPEVLIVLLDWMSIQTGFDSSDALAILDGLSQAITRLENGEEEF